MIHVAALGNMDDPRTEQDPALLPCLKTERSLFTFHSISLPALTAAHKIVKMNLRDSHTSMQKLDELQSTGFSNAVMTNFNPYYIPSGVDRELSAKHLAKLKKFSQDMNKLHVIVGSKIMETSHSSFSIGHTINNDKKLPLKARQPINRLNKETTLDSGATK